MRRPFNLAKEVVRLVAKYGATSEFGKYIMLACINTYLRKMDELI